MSLEDPRQVRDASPAACRVSSLRGHMTGTPISVANSSTRSRPDEGRGGKRGEGKVPPWPVSPGHASERTHIPIMTGQRVVPTRKCALGRIAIFSVAWPIIVSSVTIRPDDRILATRGMTFTFGRIGVDAPDLKLSIGCTRIAAGIRDDRNSDQMCDDPCGHMQQRMTSPPERGHCTKTDITRFLSHHVHLGAKVDNA